MKCLAKSLGCPQVSASSLSEGLGRAGGAPGVPVGLLAFVVVCRLLVVGDGLGRHGDGGGQGGPNTASATHKPRMAPSPLPKLGPAHAPVLLL